MRGVALSKDFWGGLMLIAIGLAAMVIARDYALGTTLRMGPGYFPTMLGGVLVLFGLHLAVRGVRGSGEKIEGGWSLRALIVVPLSFILFGLLIDRAGFVPAVVAVIVASATAGPEFRFAVVALLALGLTALCVGVFIWGLGLPYPLVVGF
jgi:hypothetical protein